MQESEKCLSRDAMDLLLWAAKNGAFPLESSPQDIEMIGHLVDSGHLFHGQSINEGDDASSYYSITKKGFSVLQCNFLWDVYDESAAHPHVLSHVNEAHVDCDQTCLRHEVKANDSVPIKIIRKTD